METRRFHLAIYHIAHAIVQWMDHPAYRYIAFLRGINMIGHRPVKMSDVKVAFEQSGYLHIRTIGNSGNVIFETETIDLITLTEDIEKSLMLATGHAIKALIRSIGEIKKLVEADPFAGIALGRYTKLLVTFLSATPASASRIATPYMSPEKDFTILAVTTREVYSVAYLSSSRYRTGIMSFLEKYFGRDITTRNWSTIMKIAHR